MSFNERESHSYSNYPEKRRHKELPDGIQRITIVVPAFNEEQNLIGLKHSLTRQEQVLSHRYPNVSLGIIISDNGSTDTTRQIASTFGTVVTGSIPRSRGSARRIGFEAAMNCPENPSKHILISLDADTVILRDDYLTSIYETFAKNPDIKVSYGPFWLQLSGSGVIRLPHFGVRVLQRYKLWNRFRMNKRARKEFLNSPYDEIFPGFNFAVRADAYKATSGFSDDATLMDDHWLTYQLKQQLDSPQIQYNRRQLVITSARAIETSNNRLSLRRTIAAVIGRYASHGDDLPTSTRDSLSARAVTAFIAETERSAYALTEEQYVAAIANRRQLDRYCKQADIERIYPAIRHTTGEIIPRRYAIIKQKRKENNE